MDNKLFKLMDPFFNYIDSGDFFRKPMGWLYLLLGALNIAFPLYVLYLAIDNSIFDAGGAQIVTFILLWFVLCAAGAVSFLIWFNRKEGVESASQEGDIYKSAPSFLHFLQTLGEWFGTYMAIVGGVGGFLVWIISLADESVTVVFSNIGLSFIEVGPIAFIMAIIDGFLIIVASRFAVEILRAIINTAINTKK